MDRVQGRLGGAGARRIQDRRPAALDLRGELGREPGLADAAGAADERNSGPSPLGLSPALAQPKQLALTPGEERRAALELGRQLLLDWARVEYRVLTEDGLLELAELGAGSRPDLRDQGPARLAVGLGGVGLPPGAVEGEHALGVEALVGRVLGDQHLELGDHLPVSAGGELGVDRQLDRSQVELLEPADLG